MLTHAPVVTVGRAGDPGDPGVSAEALAAAGIEVHPVRRGGRATYHGPGQLIGYPILDLTRHRRDVHWYLRALEEVLLRALAAWGISAGRREGLTGVWVGERKIASIGVHVRRWVTGDGFALNVGPDLAGFALIRPCGLDPDVMTSVSQVLGHEVAPGEMVEATASAFADVFETENDERGMMNDE
jgi:lipoate-protein ligase B